MFIKSRTDYDNELLEMRGDSSNLPWDSNGEYGGWQAGEKRSDKNPVLFVHGHQRDADDWGAHVRYFTRREYSEGDLWAITFKNPSPTHDEMAYQLNEFIRNILDITGGNSIDIVAHSLGVTGVRHWIDKYDTSSIVDSLVLLAGANHGIPALSCVDSEMLGERLQSLCAYLKPTSEGETDAKIAKLNSKGLSDDIQCYTIRALFDKWFIGNPHSPRLENAEENTVLPFTHDGVRYHMLAIRKTYNYITS